MLPRRASNLLLSSVPWNVFGTLTVKTETGRDAYGRAIEAWLRWVARSCNVNFRSNFFFAVRFERGELGGRLHAHALLRVPRFAEHFFLVRPGAVPTAHRMWGLGLTRFRRIGEQDPAIPYVVKFLKSEHGGNVYERGKHDGAHDLLLGEAVYKRAVLQKLDTCAGAAPDGQLATLADKSKSLRDREVPGQVPGRVAPSACVPAEVSTVRPLRKFELAIG